MSAAAPAIHRYVRVFAALVALTLVTIAVAMIDLGPLNIAVALLIAVTKASLVAVFFMHLRHSHYLVWLFFGLGLIWMLVLLVATLHESASREWIPSPPGWAP